MGRNLNRRQVLGLLAATAGSTLFGRCGARQAEPTMAADPAATEPSLTPEAASGTAAATTGAAAVDSLTPTAYLPYITADMAPTPTPVLFAGRVVHVHDAGATNWDGTGWYGDAVDQTRVDAMVESGLRELTGCSTWSDIWTTLFARVSPGGYAPGQKIAIKVNFNNSGYTNGGCNGTGIAIDALPQPVKALVHGLVAAGAAQSDIWIYDATGQNAMGRVIPNRFRDVLQEYAGLQYHGLVDEVLTPQCYPGIVPITFSDSLELTVTFPGSSNKLKPRRLTSLLGTATYLINMPILKSHGISPVTLGFKNHLGSIDKVEIGGEDGIHSFINPGESSYSRTYSPLVDIYNNSTIRDKTILTVGDALYGAFGATAVPPVAWSTFGDAPNSLLFAADPVAIDCVMVDLLRAEGKVGNSSYDYLFCAEEAGLGICEGSREAPGGNPWQQPYGSGYRDIDYIRQE